MVNYKNDLMLYVIGAVLGFIFSPVICYLCIILYYIYGVIVFMFTDDFPSSGSFWEAPFTIMQAWYFYLVVLAIIMVGSWIERYNKEKYDEKLSYQAKHDLAEIESQYNQKMQELEHQYNKKIEDVFDQKQYSEFRKLFYQRRESLQKKIDKHQLSDSSACQSLKDFVRNYMWKRNFNPSDVEWVCNHMERI